MGRVTQKNKCCGRTKICHLKRIGDILLKACALMFIVATNVEQCQDCMDLFDKKMSELACAHKLWAYFTGGVDASAAEGSPLNFQHHSW